MAAAYASVEDIQGLWRPLTEAEKARAEKLLPIVSDDLRQKAHLVGKDLDQMIKDGELYEGVLISVVVDVVARTLMTSTEGEPLTQESQSALGYSWSGTYLVPGGGLFIKKSELARLGLKRQRYGVIETWDATSEG